eukprot:PhF_6_TR20462/c0_g1_i2/m.29418
MRKSLLKNSGRMVLRNILSFLTQSRYQSARYIAAFLTLFSFVCVMIFYAAARRSEGTEIYSNTSSSSSSGGSPVIAKLLCPPSNTRYGVVFRITEKVIEVHVPKFESTAGNRLIEMASTDIPLYGATFVESAFKDPMHLLSKLVPSDQQPCTTIHVYFASSLPGSSFYDMKRVRVYLEPYPFRIGEVKVMDAATYNAMTWLGLRHMTAPTNKDVNIGFVSWDEEGSHIAFRVPDAHLKNTLVDIPMGPHTSTTSTWKVFQHTHLSYDTTQEGAFHHVYEVLNSEFTLPSEGVPCLAPGTSVQYGTRTLRAAEVLSFDQCLSFVSQALHKGVYLPCPVRPCSFDSVYQPSFPSDIQAWYLLGKMSDVFDSESPTTTYPELKHRGRKECTSTAKENVKFHCLEYALAYVISHRGYGVPARGNVLRTVKALPSG